MMLTGPCELLYVCSENMFLRTCLLCCPLPLAHTHTHTHTCTQIVTATEMYIVCMIMAVGSLLTFCKLTRDPGGRRRGGGGRRRKRRRGEGQVGGGKRVRRGRRKGGKRGGGRGSGWRREGRRKRQVEKGEGR